MRKRNLIATLALYFISTTSVWADLTSNLESDDSPVLYYANDQTYDAELGVLILKGHVEFSYKGEVLEADYVTYNEKADLVTASGHVRLRRPNKDIMTGEYTELTGNMKEGVIRQAKVLMSDDARIVAVEARKYENREEFDQAVYTPCQICGIGDTPTWQLNAHRVVRNNEDKKYYFTDASMRLFGIPIMYFPWLYHPTERQSGLLAPLPGYDKGMGAFIAQPLYLVLDDDKDMTLTPVFYTKQNPMFMGRYRQAFGAGRLDLEGSITKTKDTHTSQKDGKIRRPIRLPDTRGHFWGRGDFSVTENIRFKGHGGWVSDRTYFKKYPFFGHESDVSLNSLAKLEGFWDQDYAAVKVYHFQKLARITGVRQRNVGDALPFIEYHAVSGRDPLGGRFSLDTNFLNIHRIQGRDVQRGIGILGWQVPHTFPCGQVITLFAEGRADVYHVEKNGKTPTAAASISQPFVKNGTNSRLFTRGGGEIRWPFVAQGEGHVTILEPIGQFIAAPRGANAPKLPNEDSIGFEFTDANILARDRIPGDDTIDDGSRVDYGFQVISHGDLTGRWEGFVGQSYNFNRANRSMPFRMQGLGRRVSDIVARLNAEPIPGWLQAHYRTRLDQKSLDKRFTEVGGHVGPVQLRAHGEYTFVSKRAGAPNTRDFKQLKFAVSSQFTDRWSAKAGGRYDFSRNLAGNKTPHDGKLSQSANLRYQDDCFMIDFSVARTFYRDRDLKPGTTFMLGVTFKNLGEFQHKFNLTRSGNDKDRSGLVSN